ncbi:MAG: hypothetical protein HEP70_19310 [Rhodobiaceae bacterium]|jgi:hypothetical protein|nr:hypothetical protein [Rhodobiaceae bacterium]
MAQENRQTRQPVIYETHHITWEGIPITIQYCADWLPNLTIEFAMAHVTVESNDRQALPITETGFKSHFIPPDHIVDHGGAVAFVEAWLDHDAQSKDWKAHVEAQRQESLFSCYSDS